MFLWGQKALMDVQIPTFTFTYREIGVISPILPGTQLMFINFPEESTSCPTCCKIT